MKKDESRVPDRLFEGYPRLTMIDSLYFEYCEFREGKSHLVHPEDDPSQRFVLGMRLPLWQRPFVWTDAQCRLFIESAWYGLHLGTYVFTSKFDRNAYGTEEGKNCGMIIDGQQRFSALQRYFDDEIPVSGLKWSDLTEVEQRTFLHRPFHGIEIMVFDDGKLREVYDRLNFSGTPHTDDQRASVRKTANKNPLTSGM